MAVGSTIVRRKVPPDLPVRVSTGVAGSFARAPLQFPPPPPVPLLPPELLLPQAATASALTRATAIAGVFLRSILILLPFARTWVTTSGLAVDRVSNSQPLHSNVGIEHGRWPPMHGARPRCCEVVTGAERGRNRYSAETFA